MARGSDMPGGVAVNSEPHRAYHFPDRGPSTAPFLEKLNNPAGSLACTPNTMLRPAADVSHSILACRKSYPLGYHTCKLSGNYSRTRQGKMRLIFGSLKDERLSTEHTLQRV